MDKYFWFRADGPGVPATGSIQVFRMDSAKTSAHIASNESEALALAQWLFDHTTAATCRTLRDAVSRLLEGV